MSRTSNVRASRAGDQFHYLWAARRCLELLRYDTDLVAVAIEGASTDEAISPEAAEAGEEVIDVAEYYGSEEVALSRLISYIQLKHSTETPNEAWTPSKLETTINGFAVRYQKLVEAFGLDNLDGHIKFTFISNRPISTALTETLEDICNASQPRHPETVEKLKQFTSFVDSRFVQFCKHLSLKGNQPCYQLQRSILSQETYSYLADRDLEAPLNLKELVTRKALPENEANRCIRKTDVLGALGTTADELFPAPSFLESTEDKIARSQEITLVQKIVDSPTPVVIHASGGVGKSIFAQKIGQHLPTGSVAIVYDCFANGQYRQHSHPRHSHKDALVQVCNELSALGLCDPLIPTSKADASGYLKAFLHRATQSANTIRSRNTDALICIIVDAADNAEMAAQEFGEPRSFVQDLLREALPGNVRLVALCRSERQPLLNIPPTAEKLELNLFSRDETADLLHSHYPEASNGDVDEFHRLTSRNPRLQAYALSLSDSLPQILSLLGPSPVTVDDAIGAQLERSLQIIIDQNHSTQKNHVQLICTGLAVLRPQIPISILAVIADVDESAIRSFISDFGRPLLMLGDTIRFRDEPVETWFRSKFRASKTQLEKFIDVLKPFAEERPYIASCLPFLMLEAGQLTELVSMALNGIGLPSNQPIDKREIELQRLQFALKASLRAGRYLEAAKLAFKAGEETAGNSRQQILLQENTDLVAALLDSVDIQEITSRRRFIAKWLGARYAYDAGLLSYVEEFKGESRNSLRMAHEWILNWSRLSDEERMLQPVEDEDIAEMALSQLNLHGPKACSKELRLWTPHTVSFRVGRLIASRLIDHERYDDLNKLASAAENDFYLLLALTLELRTVHRIPPKGTVDRAFKLLSRINDISSDDSFGPKPAIVLAIASLVEAAWAHKLYSNDVLAALLDKYLPEPSLALHSQYEGKRYSFLSAYSLRAALKGEDLQLIDLAHPELRKQLEEKSVRPDPGMLQQFKQEIGAVLPWHKLRSQLFLSTSTDVDIHAAITNARSTSSTAAASSSREYTDTLEEIAILWFDALLLHPGGDEAALKEFQNWADVLRRPLLTSTWNSLCRIAARTQRFKKVTHEFCQRAFNLVKDAKEDAASKARTYIASARALLTINKDEARFFFDHAMEVVSKLGDEVYERWDAMMDLADRAADITCNAPEIAYRFARCAEVAKEYIYDHFAWEDTVSSLCGLSPTNAIAILSRWRDRKVGFIQRLLPSAILYLLKHRYINPSVACVFLAFNGEWEYGNMLEECLSASNDAIERQQILDHALSYIRIADTSSSTWEKIAELVSLFSLNPSDINTRLQFNTQQEESSKVRTEDNSSAISPTYAPKTIDWDTVFMDTQVHTINGLSNAYNTFKQLDPPHYHNQFIIELIERVPDGKECEFIRAVSELSQLSLLFLHDLFFAIPTEWKSKMSMEYAVNDAIKSIFLRNSLDITSNRHQLLFSLHDASQLSSLSEEDLVTIMLKGLVEQSEILSSHRLFTLIGLLTYKLSPTDALEALDFALGLFEKVLSEQDGDGPWSNHLQPPSTMNEALSGFLWASLGAPEAGFRWEAAHTVREACALNQTAIIGDLIRRAKVDDIAAFVDARLHFYNLYARLHLLIALSRAALDYPDILKEHSNFFIHYALYDESHVIIRHFATMAAKTLAANGSVSYEAAVSQKLDLLNSSTFEESSSPADNNKTRNTDSKRFIFGLDMESYWFGNLAEIFGMSVSEVECIAENIICDDWRLDYNGYWDRDERGKHKLYGDGEDQHSHGGYPRTSDLNFYLSYHSLMVAAGKLLASVPVHIDQGSSANKFQKWLNRHLLTRKDGLWLADRREPRPLEHRHWKNELPDKNWRWSVTPSDFENVLGLHDIQLNVWGHWMEISERYEETIEIDSALVSSEQSHALLRALQTAESCHDYAIPAADDDSEIDENSYHLKGWIEDSHQSNRLDEFDPWAGGIHYPPLRCVEFVCDLFELTGDVENRVWWLNSNGVKEEIIWSQVWGDWKGVHQEIEHGRRLQVKQTFVHSLLQKMNMDLIIKVSIKRELYRRYCESRSKEELEYVEPYCKLFLLQSNGKFESL